MATDESPYAAQDAAVAANIAEAERNLEVLKLEAQLIKAKGTKAGPTQELKLKVREARAKARQERTAASEEGSA